MKLPSFLKKNIVFLTLICSFLGMAQENRCPCCTEEYKAFDFWIGTWKVTNADGTEAGRNTIEKVEDNCVLKEHWISAGGKFTGTSINFYNRKMKHWEQLWVDNSGTHLKLSGNRKGNQMILSSDEFTHTDGQKYINRITWSLNDNGTVRQLWEVLQGDKVVNTVFDGLYTKTE